MPRIVAAKVAFPPHYYAQDQVLDAFMALDDGAGNASSVESAAHRLDKAKAKRFYSAVGVQGRHFTLPLHAYPKLSGLGQRNQAWSECALHLGAEAVQKVLASTDLEPEQVGLFMSSTVTGLAVPSIEARLMGRLGFASNCRRLPLFGLGCVAGAAGVARIADFLRSDEHAAALLLCVELCSLTFQPEDTSVTNIIASALFGDGVGSALLVGDEHPLGRARTPEVVASESILFPNTERTMGWHVVDDGFRILLDGSVPDLARSKLVPALYEFLAKRGLRPHDLARFIIHPGGPAVIDAIEQGLKLGAGALDGSRECLARKGNLSSVSVLSILEQELDRAPPPLGSHGLLMALGPGFCAELVLLRW